MVAGSLCDGEDNVKISFATTLVGLDDRGERRWDVDSFVTEVQAGDRLGFYGAYTGERRGRGPASGKTGVAYSPDLLCSLGLARTESLVFNSHVTLLPIHHPIRIVQDACVVNSLFPGRFRLGVGAGYTQDDFRAFGVSLKERPRRMEQGLQAIRAFLDGTPMTMDGPFYGEVPELDPAMGGHPLEVLAGAWSEPGVKRAARYTDGWFTGPIRTVEAEAELAAIYRAECARYDKPARVVLMREAAIAPTDAEAREIWGDHLLEYARIYYERGGTYEERWDPWVADIESAEDMTLDMVLPDRFLCGSPETWLEAIDTWRTTIQPDEILIRLRYYYGPSLEHALDAMELVGREIIPAVAAW